MWRPLQRSPFTIPRQAWHWQLVVMLFWCLWCVSEVGFEITWHQKKSAIKPQPFPFGSQLCSSQIPAPLHFPCTFNVCSSNLHLMQAAGCKYPWTMTLILSILKPPPFLPAPKLKGKNEKNSLMTARWRNPSYPLGQRSRKTQWAKFCLVC